MGRPDDPPAPEPRQRLLDACCRSCLGGTAWYLLVTILDRGGLSIPVYLNLSDLARRLGKTAATFSHAARQLIEAGLLARDGAAYRAVVPDPGVNELQKVFADRQTGLDGTQTGSESQNGFASRQNGFGDRQTAPDGELQKVFADRQTPPSRARASDPGSGLNSSSEDQILKSNLTVLPGGSGGGQVGSSQEPATESDGISAEAGDERTASAPPPLDIPEAPARFLAYCEKLDRRIMDLPAVARGSISGATLRGVWMQDSRDGRRLRAFWEDCAEFIWIKALHAITRDGLRPDLRHLRYFFGILENASGEMPGTRGEARPATAASRLEEPLGKAYERVRAPADSVWHQVYARLQAEEERRRHA